MQDRDEFVMFRRRAAMNTPHPLTNWIERGTARRALGRHWPATLGRSKVFILPSGFGLLIAAATIVMLLVALNYQNSAVFLLAFLLGALFVVAMVSCHQQLRGLIVTGLHIAPVFAGEDIRLELDVVNKSRRSRKGLVCRADKIEGASEYLAGNSAVTLSAKLASLQRGRHRISPVTIASREPFSAFRAWSRFVDAQCIVYPRPAAHAPPPPGNVGLSSLGAAHHQPEDFLGLARYRPGDRPGQIAWSVYARRDTLERKQFGGAGGGSVWLSFEAAPATKEEAKLEILCAWALAAERGGANWGLELPEFRLPPARGNRQLQRALTALACYPGPYPR